MKRILESVNYILKEINKAIEVLNSLNKSDIKNILKNKRNSLLLFLFAASMVLIPLIDFIGFKYFIIYLFLFSCPFYWIIGFINDAINEYNIDKKINNNTNEFLRKKQQNTTFPIQKEKEMIIFNMYKFLSKPISRKNEIHGIAFNQAGLNERICIIFFKKKSINPYIIMINPIIANNSDEYCYLKEGEDCLSISNKVKGYVHRYKEIEVTYQDTSGKNRTLFASDSLSIRVQHEIDHLNGILYTDHIDINDPYKIIHGSIAISKENRFKNNKTIIIIYSILIILALIIIIFVPIIIIIILLFIPTMYMFNMLWMFFNEIKKNKKNIQRKIKKKYNKLRKSVNTKKGEENA